MAERSAVPFQLHKRTAWLSDRDRCLSTALYMRLYDVRVFVCSCGLPSIRLTIFTLASIFSVSLVGGKFQQRHSLFDSRLLSFISKRKRNE